MRRAKAFLIAGLITCAVAPARAQSCCTATGSNEFGVVGPRHLAVLAAQIAYDHGFGSFDAKGNYAQLDNAEVDDVTFTLGGGVRLGTPLLQLHGLVPLKLQHRELQGLPGETRGGLADVSLTLRATLLEDGATGIDGSRSESFVPTLEPFVGVRAPTGRSPSNSETPSQADVTGDGAWAAVAGLSVTKYVTRREAVLLGASYARRFPHDVKSAGGKSLRFTPGDEIDARLGLLHVFDLHWSAQLGATGRWTLPASSDGEEAPGSDTRRIRFVAGLSHFLTYPELQLTASLTGDPPIDGIGKQVPFAGMTAAIGVQRNFVK